jgi:ubiquinone biosynthesis monooxygenase Coq7
MRDSKRTRARKRIIPTMSPTKDPVDRFIGFVEQGLRTCFGGAVANRPSPGFAVENESLSTDEVAESVALMRVNHAGEVAAQALYAGQALLARTDAAHDHLMRAALEERDHLAWCETRLDELRGRASLLVPFWFTGGAVIGIAAALMGDATSFAFVRETERQVEAHLEDHLQRLPSKDSKSRAILEQMSLDEARHGAEAAAAGGGRLPPAARRLMGIGGGVVRQIARVL